MNYLLLCVSLTLLSAHHATSEHCKTPEIQSTTYTTQDATIVTNIAFIAEFTLKCANGVNNIPLYAQVAGAVLPVVHTGKNKYQISWTTEVAKVATGDHLIELYDEEGYGLLRKALRNDEPLTNVPTIGTLTINFPGAYQGPWVNSECMAAALAILVWYLAFSAKSKLLV